MRSWELSLVKRRGIRKEKTICQLVGIALL
jgi:hypothetical protein